MKPHDSIPWKAARRAARKRHRERKAWTSKSSASGAEPAKRERQFAKLGEGQKVLDYRGVHADDMRPAEIFFVICNTIEYVRTAVTHNLIIV